MIVREPSLIKVSVMRFFALAFLVVNLLVARGWFLSQLSLLISKWVVVVRNCRLLSFLLCTWHYWVLLISSNLFSDIFYFGLPSSLSCLKRHGAVWVSSSSNTRVCSVFGVFTLGRHSGGDRGLGGGLTSTLGSVWLRSGLLTKERVWDDLSPNLTSLFIFLKN